MSPLKQSNSIAARMGRWSASHWKTAVFGWLAFVVVVVVVGMRRRHQDDRPERRERRRVPHRPTRSSPTPASSDKNGRRQRDRADPVARR